MSVLRRWGFWFVYFGILSVFLFRFGIWLVMLWFGAVFGQLFLFIDHVLYVYVYSYELTPQRITQMISQGRYREALGLLRATMDERKHLFFQQLLGQLVLLVLGFYLVTSSGSLVAKGLILSMNLTILAREWIDVLSNPDRLRDWLFQYYRGEISERSMQLYVFGVTVVFLMLTVLAIR
jgi:hypothetical protein